MKIEELIQIFENAQKTLEEIKNAISDDEFIEAAYLLGTLNEFIDAHKFCLEESLNEDEDEELEND